MNETNEREPKKGGNTTKATLQSYIQNFSKEAIDGIVDIMRNSTNLQLKFAAHKLIIEKSIPDMKAVELSGENGGALLIKIIEDNGGANRVTDQELPQASGDL